MSFKKRYISAEEAEERIVSLLRREKNEAAEIFNTAIDACQTIILDLYDNAPDVQEVKRGKWVWKGSLGYGGWVCSECGDNYFDGFGIENFCPNCGADMREEAEDGHQHN